MVHFSPSKLLFALAAVRAVQAHTAFTTLHIDGVNQGDGTCVRMSPNHNEVNFPINNTASNDIVCNVDGDNGVARVCPAKDGAILTFEFRAGANKPGGGVLDRSHKGPCAVYMKKVESAIDDPGYGDGWFKVWHEGFDEADGRWCTEKVIDNAGFLSVKLPNNLKGGYYLVRPELLALHNAGAGDPQFYTGCAQVFLESSGTGVPAETVSIPGYLDPEDPALWFSLYTTPLELPYPIPGPDLAEFVAGGSSEQTSQTEGLKPAGCIFQNANWCATEVEDYSTEQQCWDAAEACYKQLETCWETAPPSGGENCRVLQTEYCDVISDGCGSGNINGPPNKGEDLTPEPLSPTLPAPYGEGSDGSQIPSQSDGPKDTTSSSTSGSGTPSPTSASPSSEDDSSVGSDSDDESTYTATTTQVSPEDNGSSVTTSSASSQTTAAVEADAEAETPAAEADEEEEECDDDEDSEVTPTGAEEDEDDCDDSEVETESDGSGVEPEVETESDGSGVDPKVTPKPVATDCPTVTETVRMTVYETLRPRVPRQPRDYKYDFRS